MARENIDIEVRTRDERVVVAVRLQPNMTVLQLKQQVQRSKSHLYPSRQYLTVGSGKDRVALKDDTKSLQSYGIGSDTTVLYLKDLGPQISWTTVFLVEYFGPLFIHPLVFFVPSLFYSEPVSSRSLPQKLAVVLVVIHYLKRELETLFVHRFSNGTMPVRNIFKNSSHYWVLGGIFLAYPVYHPLYQAHVSDTTAVVCAIVFLGCMLSNLTCHLILSSLRPAGTRIRRIPRGFAFEWVSCPNYTFEIGSWLAFAVMTASLTSYLFVAVSAGQMYLWAVAKHRNYRREFNGKDGHEMYPRDRKAILPYLL